MIYLKRIGICSIWTLALMGAVWAFPAFAFAPLSSTQDISVTDSGSTTIAIPGRQAGYIFLQNDCSGDVLFDLRGERDATTTSQRWPLRLATDQQFSAEMTLFGAVSATLSGETAGPCTITVIFGN